MLWVWPKIEFRYGVPVIPGKTATVGTVFQAFLSSKCQHTRDTVTVVTSLYQQIQDKHPKRDTSRTVGKKCPTEIGTVGITTTTMTVLFSSEDSNGL